MENAGGGLLIVLAGLGILFGRALARALLGKKKVRD